MNAPEKKVSCGKCGGSLFTATIAPGEEAVIISFTCSKCGKVSRTGVKRTPAQAPQKKQPQKKGILQKISESMPFGIGKQKFDVEEDLEDLLDES